MFTFSAQPYERILSYNKYRCKCNLSQYQVSDICLQWFMDENASKQVLTYEIRIYISFIHFFMDKLVVCSKFNM